MKSQIILFFAMCIAQFSQAQTFNHTYPDGEGNRGIFAEESNGGFRIVANIYANPYPNSILQIQTDPLGNQVSKTIAQVGDLNVYGLNYRLADGSFVRSETVQDKQVSLARKSPDGAVIWDKVFDVPVPSSLWVGVPQLSENLNGDLLLAGVANELAFPSNSKAIYIMKVGSDGELLWLTLLDAVALSLNNSANAIGLLAPAVTDDGGVALSICVNSSYSIARFDANGNLLFITLILDNLKIPFAITDGGNGKTAVAYEHLANPWMPSSTSKSFLQEYDLSGGQATWTTAVGPYLLPPPDSFAEARVRAVCFANGGGYLVSGYGSEQWEGRFFLAKVNSEGQVVWNRFDYGFTAQPQYLHQEADGRILVCGLKDGQTWLMVTDSLGYLASTSTNTVVKEWTSQDLDLRAFPNPFTKDFHIDFQLPKPMPFTATLFDRLGRRVAALVENEGLEAGEHHLTFPGKDLRPGLYQLRVQAGDAIHFQNLLKI